MKTAPFLLTVVFVLCGRSAIAETLHEQVLQNVIDASNGYPTCDLRSELQPHCVPGPISRILGGGNWRLIDNFSPGGIETACLGGDADACRLSQFAQDALMKRAIAQECKRDCKALQKEANKAEMVSVVANNATIIRPDGCCGRPATPDETAPALTKGEQVAAAIVAATATLYLARVCQQLRRKPVIYLNANDIEVLRVCGSHGF